MNMGKKDSCSPFSVVYIGLAKYKMTPIISFIFTKPQRINNLVFSLIFHLLFSLAIGLNQPKSNFASVADIFQKKDTFPT